MFFLTGSSLRCYLCTWSELAIPIPGSTAADLGSGSFQAVGEFLGDGQDEEVQEDEPDDNSEMDRSDRAPQPSQW